MMPPRISRLRISPSLQEKIMQMEYLHPTALPSLQDSSPTRCLYENTRHPEGDSSMQCHKFTLVAELFAASRGEIPIHKITRFHDIYILITRYLEQMLISTHNN